MVAYRAKGLLLVALVLLSVLPVSVAPGASGVANSSEQGSLSCTVRIAAVSSSGGGVLGNLTVTISWPGSGRVFISTSPAAEVDTQGSAMIASLAASILAGVDPLSLDFYYEIQAPSIIVGGPSAGAAMALAAYQLLTRGYCDSSVVATGMIQPDTSIGPVGGLKEKLEAVASGGGRVFVIPAGQEVYTYTVKKVQRWGPFIRITQEPVSVNLTEYGQKLGVEVVEASTLLEAYYRGVEGYNTVPAPRVDGVEAPEWAKHLLESYITEVNTTLQDYVSKVKGDKAIKRLAEEARALMDSAGEKLAGGSVYAAAVEAIEAGVYAELAYALSYALDHDLDVTPFVQEANSTITKAWEALFQSSTPGDSIELDLKVKAYGKLGISLYFYKKGLKALESTGNGGYRLPYNIFGGVEIGGLESVIRARWLARWAWFWANASREAPEGVPVNPARLERLASLVLATARTATAYLNRILSESGAGTAGAELPAYLVEEAVATSDPAAQLGLSLEAIAQTTRLIHEKFTLKPGETAGNLLTLALRLYNATKKEAVIPALLLGSLNATEDPKTELHMLSLAILDSWAIREATEGESILPGIQPQSTIQTPTTQAPGATSTPETTGTSTGTTTQGTRGYGMTTLVAVAAIALITGLALGSLASGRRRRQAYPP